MSSRLTLAAVAAAALFAGPVLAQTAAPVAPAAPAPGSPAAAGPTQEQIGEAGEAFGADMEAMQAELTAAKTAAGADTAKANTDADAIQAKYQTKADAFGAMFKAFIDANPGMMPPEAVAMVTAKISTAPAEVRQGVMAAPAAAPATPPAN